MAEQEQDVIVVDQNLLDTMTETERGKFLRELSLSRKTYIVNGVRCVYDSNPAPISISYSALSDKQKSRLRK